MDTDFIAAIRCLNVASDRCTKALATDVMNEQETQRVRDVREECQKLIPTIEGLWRDIDTLSRSGVALPKKEMKAGDLFA